jgi:2-Cys peroxiredoxin 5
VKDYERLKGEGVEIVVCVSVNDPFVMSAWEKDQGTKGKVRMLADTAGAFTKVWLYISPYV